MDFVRVPGVIKLRNGEYVSLSLHIDIEETLAMRSSIIRHTADIFDPDLLIVDKEPLGLRGEARETLDLLRRRGTPLVLGLRDVMDDPDALEIEWQRKHAVPALREYYDDIWVYGLPQVCDPLAGVSVPASVRRRMTYTGYLRRNAPAPLRTAERERDFDGEFFLVTPGGGGDGDALIELVLSAYEQDPGIPLPALLVFGPFMLPERRAAFAERAARLGRIRAITFDARMETLMARAAGVVAMGGYNTFCEILSFDKRALIVPRRAPRLEQLIRARRAAELGLVAMLSEEAEGIAAQTMAAALRQLPQQPPPSSVVIPGLLDGMASVNRLAHKWLEEDRPRSLPARQRLKA
ncbi:MAG TPA: glycosyltransferase [Stellaceae bacterium]|nr:glycosyltransferase [Stellaceae bacterium]